jgi:hypothetical protein
MTSSQINAGMDLDGEIERQRKLGFETYQDYLSRTGFPHDEASFQAWITEGKWMITSKCKL